jgi:NADH:ubiquinone oxidoreductase subunit 3 (subunit A)
MFVEYFLILKYFVVCLCFVLLLFGISFFSVYQHIDAEKYSSYECGFNPFEDARIKFEVRFYLVAILFIIFDLEIVFVFPWVVVFFQLPLAGICTMFCFIIILTLGFLFE